MAGSHGGGDLIAAIYDAIIEPSGWDDVVKRIVEATKSVSGGIIMEGANAAHISASCNIDPFYADEYVRKWYRKNPLDAAAATIAPGEVQAGSYITQTDSFKVSAFCNEYFRPQGWADVAAVGIVRAAKTYGVLALQRSPDAVWVEPEQWQLLETLAPHLQRAAAIHDLLSRTRATTESLGAAVAAAGFAIPFDRRLPGRLRQRQGRGPRAARNRLAI